ncbi:MAG: FecR domain-containing protein [Pseudomonadota bacterium]
MKQHNQKAFDEAIEWQGRMQELPVKDATVQAFMAWFKSDAVNQQAWVQVEEMRALAEARALEDIASHQETPLAAVRPHDVTALPRVETNVAAENRLTSPSMSTGKALKWLAAPLFIALALVVSFYSNDFYVAYRADHFTGHGEKRQVTLVDGSVVQLNARSAIAVDASDQEQRITLLAGDALFTVKPNEARSFLVEAGATEVRVLGTKFEVRRTLLGAAVGVAEGQVAVHAESQEQPAAVLKPGEAVLTTDDKSEETQSEFLVRKSIAVDAIAAWRNGRLIADDWPLTDVLNAIARHYKGRIIYSSWLIGGGNVTGVYELNEPITALRLIASTHGWKVRKLSSSVIVLSPI